MHDTTPNDADAMLEELRTATGAETNGLELTIGAVEDATEDIADEFEELLEQVQGSLPTDEVEFDESIVKENLEEILLMLIAMHGETHGKMLLSDLSQFFGTQLSPGTVYPSLHTLEEDGVLSMHAKVRTKEYSIADERAVRARIEQTMVQHLAFGMLMYSFLPRL